MKKITMILLTLILLGSSARTDAVPGPWDKLSECKEVEGGYLCPKTTLAAVYNDMVNMFFERLDCVADLEAEKKLHEYDVMKCESKRSAWYTKWYITGTGGLLTGIILGGIFDAIK